MSEAVDNRNEVNIDLEKYMSLVEKLDGAEDTISALKTEAEAADQDSREGLQNDLFSEQDVGEQAQAQGRRGQLPRAIH